MLQDIPRILIVDDDPLLRETFERGLTRTGYECVAAGSASDAEQALEQEEFHLVLLDITMPDKSGLELLTDLRKKYPDMAVVMVTGRDDLSTGVFAMLEGACDYITKPVTLTQLIFGLERALSRRALLLENKVYREQLEALVIELNLRLEQNRGVVAALNSVVRALIAREPRTPEAYAGLQTAVTAIDSGIESLVDFAKNIVTGAPDPGRPG